MKNIFIIVVLLFFAMPVWAIEYIPDPVYEALDPDAPHPMAEIIGMAEDGDARAQFILGDVYAKGKGGLAVDTTEAKKWFIRAAQNGYPQGFIRLAALEKREKNSIRAHQWYTLAMKHLPHGDWRKHATTAREELLNEAKLSEKDLEKSRTGINVWYAELREKRKEKKRRARIERNKQTKRQKEIVFND